MRGDDVCVGLCASETSVERSVEPSVETHVGGCMQTSFDIPKSLADELSRVVGALKAALLSRNSGPHAAAPTTPSAATSTLLPTALPAALPKVLAESVAHVDLALADLIDLDAASFRASGSSTLSATATLTRYLDALHAHGVDSARIARQFPSTLEAAILAALHAPHSSAKRKGEGYAMKDWYFATKSL